MSATRLIYMVLAARGITNECRHEGKVCSGLVRLSFAFTWRQHQPGMNLLDAFVAMNARGLPIMSDLGWLT